MEDLPRETLWELIPVVKEDSNDIPIFKENKDPIPIPPPCIRNTGNIEIVKEGSHVSCQCCIQLLGQISRQTPDWGTIATEHLQDSL